MKMALIKNLDGKYLTPKEIRALIRNEAVLSEKVNENGDKEYTLRLEVKEYSGDNNVLETSLKSAQFPNLTDDQLKEVLGGALQRGYHNKFMSLANA